MRNKSQAKSVLHLHARRMETAGLVQPGCKKMWLFPESGPQFLGWKGLLQKQGLPRNLEITVQSTSYNPGRFEIRLEVQALLVYGGWKFVCAS